MNRLMMGLLAAGLVITAMAHADDSKPGSTNERFKAIYTDEWKWRQAQFPGLDDEDLASVVAAMKEVRQRGLEAARHLDGEIYEVRADGKGVIYRVLFAAEGKHKQVFLSLEAIKKKSQKTPPNAIGVAKRRLRDWRARGN